MCHAEGRTTAAILLLAELAERPVHIAHVARKVEVRRKQHQETRLVCLFVCLFACLSIRLSVCLSVCLFVCLSVCLSVCLYLSVCLSFCLSVCLSVCLSLSLSVCLSVSLPVCLSVCLSPCLSVCLSLSLSASGGQDYLCLSVCLKTWKPVLSCPTIYLSPWFLVFLLSLWMRTFRFICLLADFSPLKRPRLKVY